MSCAKVGGDKALSDFGVLKPTHSQKLSRQLRKAAFLAQTLS